MPTRLPIAISMIRSSAKVSGATSAPDSGTSTMKAVIGAALKFGFNAASRASGRIAIAIAAASPVAVAWGTASAIAAP
jgi:hypothetical protein